MSTPPWLLPFERNYNKTPSSDWDVLILFDNNTYMFASSGTTETDPDVFYINGKPARAVPPFRVVPIKPKPQPAMEPQTDEPEAEEMGQQNGDDRLENDQLEEDEQMQQLESQQPEEEESEPELEDFESPQEEMHEPVMTHHAPIVSAMRLELRELDQAQWEELQSQLRLSFPPQDAQTEQCLHCHLLQLIEQGHLSTIGE